MGYSQRLSMLCVVAVMLIAAGLGVAYVAYHHIDRDPETFVYATDAAPAPRLAASDPEPGEPAVEIPRNHADSTIPALEAMPDAIPPAITVWGVLEAETGEPVGGETVILYSPSQNRRYVARSNDHGEFVFHELRPARDFRLSVYPRGRYRRYRQFPVPVGPDDNGLKVILKPLVVGDLAIVVVDGHGAPVAGLELSFRSGESAHGSAAAVTGRGGMARVPNFPGGSLTIRSRRGHRLQARGMTFDPESTAPLSLVVDIGRHRLGGHVYDEFGQPYAGAEAFLFWSRQDGGATVRATRQVTADPRGVFWFEGLGPGPHELVVSAAGLSAVRRMIDIGVDAGEVNIILGATRGR